MSNPDANPQGHQRFKRAGYERRDANAKWIIGLVLSLLVAGLIMHFAIAGMMKRFERKALPRDQWTGLQPIGDGPTETNAVPHLQLAPPEDLKRFRAREEMELNTYGWINRTAGVVRIPIDRAMDLVLQRGLPVRTESNRASVGPSSYQLQQERARPQPKSEGQP